MRLIWGALGISLTSVAGGPRIPAHELTDPVPRHPPWGRSAVAHHLREERYAVSRPCRAAVPTAGRRSKPSPRFSAIGSARFRGPVGPRCRRSPAFQAVPALLRPDGQRARFRGPVGPRCRTEEVGGPSRPRASSRLATGSFARCGERCRSEDRRSLPSPRFCSVSDGSSARCAGDAGQFSRWGPEDRRSLAERGTLRTV